jgi:hypothetical protein
MKRALGSLLLGLLGVVAFGQANFTIVRPYDGAHVREKIHVLFPKGSIPSGGYVGIFLNGQLMDALVPPSNGKFYEYILDTKERGIPDTKPGQPDRLEAKLYVDYNDQPKVTKVSSVDLYVGNQANIRVPANGIFLRYRFTPGSSMVYDLEQRVAEDTISESENGKGGKPAELPLDVQRVRLMYSVDNSYGNGQALVRLQALPDKGQDFAVFTTISSTSSGYETRAIPNSDMASSYMKLDSRGQELFGSISPFFAMEGPQGDVNTDYWRAIYPLPTLPLNAVEPGDTWASEILQSNVSGDPADQTSLVKTFPARGDFVDVEWERDHPCAKITNTIEVSEMSNEDRKQLAAGAAFGGEKLRLDETIWFALDTHKILKIVRDTTIETKTGTTKGPAVQRGGAPGNFSRARLGSGAIRPSQLTAPSNQVVPLDQGPIGGLGGKLGGIRRFNGNGGGQNSNGGPPNPGRTGQAPASGNAANQTQYVRLRIQQIFTLEG